MNTPEYIFLNFFIDGRVSQDFVSELYNSSKSNMFDRLREWLRQGGDSVGSEIESEWEWERRVTAGECVVKWERISFSVYKCIYIYIYIYEGFFVILLTCNRVESGPGSGQVLLETWTRPYSLSGQAGYPWVGP